MIIFWNLQIKDIRSDDEDEDEAVITSSSSSSSVEDLANENNADGRKKASPIKNGSAIANGGEH